MAIVAVVALIALVGGAFVIMSGSNDNGGNGCTRDGDDGSDTSDVTRYPIHIYSQPDKHTVEGLPQEAAPDESISFTVNNLSPHYSTIDIVVTYVPGYPIAYGNGNSCTFTMPSGDATVIVNVTEYSEKRSDDHQVVDSNAMTTITRSNGDYSDGSLQLATIWVDVTSNQYTNCHKIDCLSLNQGVIPDNAITVDEVPAMGSFQYVDGLDIHINRELIDAVTALIVLQTEVGSHNYPAEVVIEITVTDPAATASV